MLVEIITWPFKTASNLLTFLINSILSIVLFPFKLVYNILRSLWNRLNNALAWAEPKILYLKSVKPFVYIFPQKGVVDPDLSSSVPVTNPVLGLTHGKDKRDLTARGCVRRRPPTQHTRSKENCDEDMTQLIQELLEFSKQHQSPVRKKKHSPAHTKSSVVKSSNPPATEETVTSSDEEDNEKVMKLIKDLQEIANSKSKRAAAAAAKKHQKGKPLSESLASNDDVSVEEDTELTQLLSDLNVLESYVSRFLDEQQQDGSGTLSGRQGEAPLIDTGSLETITEEELSKECSPVYGGTPQPTILRSVGSEYSSSEYSDYDGTGINEPDSLLQKVAESEDLQQLLKQIADTIHQTESDVSKQKEQRRHQQSQAMSSLHQPLSSEVIPQQYKETEMEFKSVIDSLENQHKFIETQQELQEMMNSLDPNTITINTSVTSTPETSAAANGSNTSTLLDHQQQFSADQQTYDSLNPQLPVYSLPNKHKDNNSSPRQPQPIDDQIYDSIMNVNPETNVDETPPPIPLKRIPSDGGMSSASSNEHSPKGDRRRRRNSSGDEEHCSSSRHSRHHHHRSRRHSRRHSSRRSECHCHCYDDHSPERERCSCDHHSHDHRPRSRERRHHHCHHRHHGSRSDSEESQCRRRVPRESSGYESNNNDESPQLNRKVKRSYSDAAVPVTTPKETRRGFLGGLFSRKSTTSLNSLSSRMSDTGDNFSVSSYKL